MGRIEDLITIKDGDYLPCFCSGCGRSIKYRGEASITWAVVSNATRRIVVSHSGCRLDFQSTNFYDVPTQRSLAVPKRFGPVRKKKKIVVRPTQPPAFNPSDPQIGQVYPNPCPNCGELITWSGPNSVTYMFDPYEVRHTTCPPVRIPLPDKPKPGKSFTAPIN